MNIRNLNNFYRIINVVSLIVIVRTFLLLCNKRDPRMGGSPLNCLDNFSFSSGRLFMPSSAKRAKRMQANRHNFIPWICTEEEK